MPRDDFIRVASLKETDDVIGGRTDSMQSAPPAILFAKIEPKSKSVHAIGRKSNEL